MNDTLNDIKKVYHFSKDNPTKYYRENHNHIPPWILFKNVSFNTIIDLFSFLNKNEKLELISEYDFFITNKISDDEKIEMFKNMLNIVRKFRNKIAHNYKIIGVHLDKTMLHLRNIRTILPYKLISLGDIKNKRGENDLYSMVLSLLFLLEPYFLKLFFIYELNNFKYPGYINYFNKCNFPANFIENLQITSEKLREDLYMKFK
jgi:abortive infection bacteriophage resistance protein